MLRRCIRDLPSVRSVRRFPRPIATQTPYLLSTRNNLSTGSKPNQSPKTSPTEEKTESGQSFLKGFVITGFVVGAGAAAAYNFGYMDLLLKGGKSPVNSSPQQDTLKIPENLEKYEEKQLFDEKPASLETETEEKAEEKTELTTPVEEPIPPVIDKEPESYSGDKVPILDDKLADSEVLSQDSGEKDMDEIIVTEKVMDEGKTEQTGEIDTTVSVSQDSGTTEAASSHDTHAEMPKDQLETETAAGRKPLAESYSLHDKRVPEVIPEKVGSGDYESRETSENQVKININTEEEGKVVLDLIEAIHAAERKQAESDAYFFSEEKRRLKEKYEKELKDARARELMYAEEVAILEKELNKEKTKAANMIKSLQEKAEQTLREELQHKEEEADKKLEKVQELSKAELAAAISREKTSQIERIAEANLNINALCMAFYARSEEARQSHSVHKLALATLGMEEALSRGLPIRAEVESLRNSLEGIDKDSLLELALASLPTQVLESGTETQMQLTLKFDALKGALRHFSLIPAGGGGILTHAVARFASSIKMREGDQSGDGIESLITRVEGLIVNGRLAEAAEALELGLRGSEAEGVALEWVRQAKARAIAEQTLSLLQSYAASITFS